MGDANHDRPSIGKHIIDAVRDGNASSVGAEAVVVDRPRRQIPTRAGILEGTDQFALVGIDAGDGQAAAEWTERASPQSRFRGFIDLALDSDGVVTSRLLCSVGTKGRHDDFGHTCQCGEQRVLRPISRAGHGVELAGQEPNLPPNSVLVS